MRIRNKSHRVSKKLITGSSDTKEHVSKRITPCKYFIGKYNLDNSHKINNVSSMSDTDLLCELESLNTKSDNSFETLFNMKEEKRNELYFAIRANMLRREMKKRGIEFDVVISSEEDKPVEQPRTSQFMKQLKQFCDD